MRKGWDHLLGRPAAALILFLVSLGVGWKGFDWIWAGLSHAPWPGVISVNLRTTQYFFDYQDLGFVKRGLVATLLHPFPVVTSRVGLVLFCWAILLLFAFQFWRFFLSATATAAREGRGRLALLCAAMPAFFLRLGNDFGRFDPIDLIAMLAVFQLVAERAGFALRFRCMLASVIAALAILVHEDFIFFALPMLAALVPLRSWLRVFALPALAAAAVMFWGRPRLNYPELADFFSHNAAYRAAVPGGQPQFEEISVLTRTLWDNFVLNGRMFVQKRAIIHLPIIAAWFAFAVVWAKDFYRRNDLRRDGLYWAAFTPLLLAVVGFDYYRWVAMTAVNLIFVVLLQCRRLADEGKVPVIGWGASSKILVASVVLGPIGNTKSFLYFFLFLQKLSPWPINW